MDYREQANLMQRDAEEFDGPGYIIGDLRQGAKSITDLLARAEAAEARAEAMEMSNRMLSSRITEAEDESKELLGILLDLKRTDNHKKCSVVFEMTYSDALSAEQLETVASYVFRGLMKADQERRNKRGNG